MYQTSDLYFQRRKPFSSECKCAINNILGSKEVDSQLLKDIGQRFVEQTNEIYRRCGGDFHVDVMIETLRVFGKECRLLEGGKPKICKELEEDNPKRVGFLINRKKEIHPVKEWMGFSDRHWIAVRKHGPHFYLFDADSDSKIPQHILYLQKFIEAQIEKGSYLFQVMQE